MRSSKERLVNELNRTNNQTLAVTDIGFANPGSNGVGLQTRLTAVALSTGTIASAGQANVTYNRMDLETVFNMVGRTLSVMVGDSIRAILPSLRRYTGLVIDAVDVLDTAINWVDGQASVEITASPRSLSWVGSTSLTLTLTPLALSSVFRNPVVDVSDIAYITQANLFARELRVNGGYVPLSAVEFSTPRTVTHDNYNTEITVTAKANTGYVGSATFAYTRRDFISVFGDGFDVKNDTVTSWDLVPYFTAAKGDIIAVDDIINQPIDYSVIPSYFNLTANASSLTYAGMSRIDVRRRQDYANTITINLTQTDEAFSQSAFEQEILNQSTGNPNVDVYVNIAKDIYLVGETAARAALTLGSVGNLTAIQWYLRNEGTIYGRGGDSPDPSGLPDQTCVPGMDGGDAINIVAGTTVEITNLGRIVGGGGGGGSTMGTLKNSQQGSGGVPLGRGSTNATAYTTNSNQVTLAYYDPALGQTNGAIYPYGGGGGEWGQPGEYSRFRYTNTSGVTNDWVVSAVSNPGKAVNGDTSNLTYVEQGVLIPMQVKLPAYFDNIPRAQSISGYTVDPDHANRTVVFFNTIGINSPKTSMLLKALDLRAADGSGTYGKLIGGIDGSWLLYQLDGQLLMLPPSPVYGTTTSTQISWNTLYNAGAVYGSDDEGIVPGVTPTLQNAKVMVGTDIWRVRLLKGDAQDPATLQATGRADSEWDRLILPLGFTQTGGIFGEKFAKFTGALASTTLGSGSYQYMQNLYSDGVSRLSRGGVDLSTYTGNDPDNRSVLRGWKPVLEYVGPGPGDSEYQRFLAWVAGRSDVTDQRSVQAGISLPLWTSVGITGKRVLVKVNDQSTAFVAQMYGSPYGGLSHANRSYADNMMPHLIGEGAAYAENASSGRAIMVLSASEGAAATVLTQTTYNGYTSNVNSSYKDILWRFTEVVYFNALTNRMMVWNPNTKSTPTEFVFWVGDKQSLSSLITARTLGVLPKDTTSQNFIDKVMDIADVDLYAGHLVFSNPVAYTGSEGNRKVTITAIDGGRYTGSVDVYFTRPNDTVGIAVPPQFQYPLSTAFTGTVRAYVRRFHAAMHATYFANRRSDEWDLTPFTVAAGDPPPSFDVRFGSEFTGFAVSRITINPNQANWWGPNTLAAWDSSMFNGAGFTDAVGNALTVKKKIYGVTGNVLLSPLTTPLFGNGVRMTTGGVFVPAGKITPAQLSGSWTVDFLCRQSAANRTANPLSLFLFGATVDFSAAVVNDKFVIGSEATGANLVYWNGSSGSGILLATDPASPLLAAGWMHVAIVRNGAIMQVYINGVRLTNVSVAITPNAAWEVGVGSKDSGGTIPLVDVERWRFRTGVQLDSTSSANDLYPYTPETSTPLSTMVTSRSLGTLPANLSTAGFLKQIPVVSGVLDGRFVTVSAISDYVGSEGNSKVTLTGSGIYSGSVDVYFTRVRISRGVVPTRLWRFPATAAFTGTPFAFMQQYYPDVCGEHYPGCTVNDFSTTAISVAANALPVQTITLTPIDVWRYLPEPTITINPNDTTWAGSDLVSAWDSSQYVAAGFTDRAGVQVQGQNNVSGNAGTYPAKGNQPFAFGGGLNVLNGQMSTAGTIAGSLLEGAWTVDVWMSLVGTAPSPAYRGPFSFMQAKPSLSAANINNRLQAGPWDTTVANMAVWNNAASPVFTTAIMSQFMKAGWQHIALTYDGAGTWKWYRNGVLVATNTGYKAVKPADAVQLGLWGITVNGTYPVYERWRFRTGVKLQDGYTVESLYVE